MANGIQPEEKLAVLIHRRRFAQMRLESPLTSLASAPEALGIAEIAHMVAKGSGRAWIRLALASRDVHAALNSVTLQNPTTHQLGVRHPK